MPSDFFILSATYLGGRHGAERVVLCTLESGSSRSVAGGELTYTYDKNGNPASLVYPGGVEAVTTYDYADRPAALLAKRPGKPDQPLVTSAGYLPSGPLSSLTLGNGLTETRSFNTRYFPSFIKLGSLLTWNYSTDNVGNVLSITDALNPAGNRTYGYQDIHYFLTQGNGPWGPRAWTYDKIGNRLTETRGAVTDTYSYLSSSTGRTPILSQIQLGAGGNRAYQYGSAGHLEKITAGTDATTFRNDDAGRLAGIERSGTNPSVSFVYDGRSYLNLAGSDALPFLDGFESGDICAWTAALGITVVPACPVVPVVRPTYSSEGLLHTLTRTTAPERSSVFYFAGRPVAQLDLSGGVESWKFLTVDHLGTPIAATTSGGSLFWQGGFEPFGADWNGASTSGIFLRFPGQWEEKAWRRTMTPGEIYQTTESWLDLSSSRITEADQEYYFAAAPYLERKAASPAAGLPSHLARVALTSFESSFGLELAERAYARVVCDCNGGFKWIWVAAPPEPYRSCIESCVEAHEKEHIKWLRRKLPLSCKGKGEGGNPAITENDRACSECSALDTSSKCLEKKLARASRSGLSAHCQFVIRERELPVHLDRKAEECKACQK